MAEVDLVFRNNAKARFPGNRFENLYRGWKAGRLTEANIRQEFGSDDHPHTVHFAGQILPRIAPANTETGESRVQTAEIGPTTPSSPVSAPPSEQNPFVQAQVKGL